VNPTGAIGSVREYSYDDGAWQSVGDLGSLGVQRFNAKQLLALQGRLAASSELRAHFSRLYSGGGPPEIVETNWRGYWCAATEFSATAYQLCQAQHGLGLLTPRGIRWLTIACICAALAIAAMVVLALRRRPLRR
jgi:hypothetical protein